jgi:hypothetical protein
MKVSDIYYFQDDKTQKPIVLWECANKAYETITKEVADICLLCGLTVKEKGIGWIITKKPDKLLGVVYC